MKKSSNDETILPAATLFEDQDLHCLHVSRIVQECSNLSPNALIAVSLPAPVDFLMGSKKLNFTA